MEMISKSAEIISNYKQKVLFTDSARQGWEMILRSLRDSDKILLPSYIGITDREGSGIFDPVIATNTNYDFYLLEKDLSISISELANCFEREQYDLILLVHYFGFKIQNFNKIIEVCKKYDVIVVEDCAHLYNFNNFNISDVGIHGDFAFYSLHKNFPISKGGLLVQNNPNVLSIDFESQSNVDQIAKEVFAYNYSNIAQKRINNFKYLDFLIKDIQAIEPLKKIGNSDIPHTFPILVENNLREKLYFWMMNQDIPLIALYYRLIDNLHKPKFKEMSFLSNNILNLPIHQDVNKEDLEFLVEKLIEGLEKLSI